jgi:hypothetical protein
MVAIYSALFPNYHVCFVIYDETYVDVRGMSSHLRIVAPSMRDKQWKKDIMHTYTQPNKGVNMRKDASRGYPAQATQAAFPLGGVGTGNVSIGARGDLRDWEIYNAPAKGTYLPNTFVAVSLLPAGGERITRVVEGPVSGTHALSHGYHPHTGVGLPRFAQSTLAGTYPIAEFAVADPAVPATITLEAFTPLVPLQPVDSGIPGAIFNYTITNTGSRGALFDTPIINLPQVAILGTGAIVKRAVVMADDNGNDLIAVRSMVYLALSYDHRLIDGADAARFLGAIKHRLEEGSFEGDLNTA